MGDDIKNADRPSRHGASLGAVLADLAEAGRAADPTVPEPCGTCAFRRGSMPNQMAGTGIVALNTILGIDTDDFACHHGMEDGEPTRLCAGYIAALLAPFSVTKEALIKLGSRLDDSSGPDEVRAAFDAWLAEVDPDGKMDVYQLGRAYARTAKSAGSNRQTF
jgi:hypothetical protein